MNTIQDDGGAAFPGLHPNMECRFADSGMSLRDWFAGMALQGTAANPAFHREKWETHAAACYKAADAMLAARKEAR